MKKSHKTYDAAKGKKGLNVPTGNGNTHHAGRRFALTPRAARWLTYGVGFAALFAFFTWIYGDVLTRTEQDSYVSTSPDTMYYLLSQPWGRLWWLMRWPLLLFKWAAVGGLLLAAVYTLTARFTDYALRLPRRWEGLGFLLPVAQIGWMVWQGTNLYYKNEPSRFLLIALACLLLTAVLAGVVWLVRRKTHLQPAETVRPYGLAVVVVLVAATSWVTLRFNENEILTARLQNLCAEERWDEMIDQARSARQPSRAVAAYHAIALLQKGQLLDGVFDIPYDYPVVRLEKHDGSEEYGLFLTDCSLHAGLINAGYRNAMDRLVMDGPRISTLKQLAICSLLNGEEALCRKYMHLIKAMPFEQDFVEKYEPLIGQQKLIDAEPMFHDILSRYPRESRFEQNYQPPAFLGYNIGLQEGSDAVLQTSVAACLYSKDLQSFLLRAQIMAQKGMPFPACVQQALAILSLKKPELLQAFPQVGRFVPDEIRSFLMDAKPYVGDRLALRHELRNRWLGTYVYYYYTENNDPDQVMKPQTGEKSGVN
ncbi:MAG: DUF6057 family protein [Alloprevotella sp.]|nr:DUF6057 family protein [Alloprevotella sp.]